jgi:cysteinyl-tRNA synthetase
LHGDPDKYLRDFEAQMDDDFNGAGAMAVLSAVFAALNELCDKPPVKDKAVVLRTLKALRERVGKLATVFGLFEDEPSAYLLRRRGRAVKERSIDEASVERLILERQKARAEKNFAEADRLRADLLKLGVEIMDTPAGTTWKVTHVARGDS